jgi:hypothetical protein
MKKSLVGKKLAFTLATVASIACIAVDAARAQGRPAVLPRSVRGQEAITALGKRLTQVAQDHVNSPVF